MTESMNDPIEEQNGGNGVAELDNDPALKAEQEKAQGYLANWQRAEADLQNYKKRVDQERSDLAKYGTMSIIRDLLTVLDDLDRAISNAGDAGADWVKGVELTRRNFATTLGRYGVKEIPALGLAFDPNLHEAVMQLPGEEGKVITVVKTGYRLHDRVVRPSMVAVGNGQ